MDVSYDTAKDFLLLKDVEQVLQLLMEHPGHNVRPILDCLVRKKLDLNLRPVGVCREGQEQVWFATLAYDAQGILEELCH